MNVLDWYAAFGTCIATPAAITFSVESMIEMGKWPAWTRTAGWTLAGIAWVLGLGYVMQASA